MKGVDLIMKAFAKITENFKDVELWLAGSASESFCNKDLARDLDVYNRVKWLGTRSDVPLLMSACDIYVQPSRSEAFGLTGAEAMAAARPVVSANVGGVPEVVEDGVTGILVDPGNVEALAEAISVFLKDPEKRKRMGKAGRERAANLFQLEKEIDGIMSLYGKA